MRAVFGVVALLVVLAVIGMVAARQMKSGSRALSVGTEAATSGQDAGRPDAPPAPAGNIREQSQQLQQRVKDDVSRALEQGAAARKEAAEK